MLIYTTFILYLKYLQFDLDFYNNLFQVKAVVNINGAPFPFNNDLQRYGQIFLKAVKYVFEKRWYYFYCH